MARVLRSALRGGMLLGLLTAARMDGMVRTRWRGMRPGPEGAVWVHEWCRRIVDALGIAVTREGTVPGGDKGALAVVSNHLSYLDILVYSAIRPFVMVAKSEVRDWPLLGWITAQAGTVYVERADLKGGRTQTHAEVNAAMAEAFRSGLPVLFFPEGTTTDGAEVLPFRRGLFHSVLRDAVRVKVAAVGYRMDGEEAGATVEGDVCYWGDADFARHLFGCMGLRGVKASVRFGAEVVPGADRFALAENSRAMVRSAYADLQNAAPERSPAQPEVEQVWSEESSLG